MVKLAEKPDTTKQKIVICKTELTCPHKTWPHFSHIYMAIHHLTVKYLTSPCTPIIKVKVILIIH